MKEKIVRHLGILFLIALGAVLLFADKFISKTPTETKFAGVLALIWAAALIRTSMGEDGKMKKVEETSFYKKTKEDPTKQEE